MRFIDIEDHIILKDNLIKSAQQGRISHAQFFYGPEGNGALALAIAYAQYLSCTNKGEDDSCGSCSSCKQFSSFNYPDLHFVYPVAKTAKSSDKPLSSDFINEWKELFAEEKYFGLLRWLEQLGIENKQAQISVYESADILRRLQLKSYSGGYKFLILWLPERLNTSASNKLLKIIEEPPQKTVFLLVSEDPESVIQTITSRCQKVFVPKFPERAVHEYLIHNEVEESSAQIIAKLSEGNMAKALQQAKKSESYKNYAIHFSSWVRSCFKAEVHPILNWVEDISKLEREKLKDFLRFCSSTFRDSFNMNFLQDQVSNQTFTEIKFELNKFAPFIHLNNTPSILELIDKASYDIGRNGNPKVILTDVSLNLARLLRVKL